MTEIGRCSSCFTSPCTKPRVKKNHPSNGCTDWTPEHPIVLTKEQKWPEAMEKEFDEAPIGK